MFNENERKVFGPYFNGSRHVYVDPLAVHRRLFTHCGGDPNRYLRDSHADDPHLRCQAKEVLLGAARLAFEMDAFSPETGQGALEQDVMAVLRTYLEWMGKKDQPGPTSPTCSPPTAPAYLPPAGSITSAG